MIEAAPSEKMRILFVDDEPSILSGLRALLHRQRKDWEMVFALGGEEAIEQLEGRFRAGCHFDDVLLGQDAAEHRNDG